jgi:S1-C subfamily serine protease
MAMLTVWAPSTACAQATAPAALVIHNQSAATVTQIFIVPEKQSSWRRDVLAGPGGRSLRAGQEITIMLPADRGCVFDVRAQYTGNRFEELRAIDLCTVRRIVLEQPRGLALGQKAESTANFTAVNQSRKPMRELAVSTVDSTSWSGNLLNEPLPHGGQSEIRLPDAKQCHIHLRAVFEDGMVEEKRRRNICTVKRHVFTGRAVATPASSRSAPADTPPPSAKPEPSVTYGSGFLVSAAGHALTNSHVVVGCGKVTALRDGEALPLTITALDHTNDLALLKLAPARGGVHAHFRAAPAIRAGDDVIAAGFPLPQVLKNGLNVTRGNVSAMGGIGGNSANMQMTAPVQPGNSGGPLFDMSGNVVGVVVSRLNSKAVKTETQNVNYAIQAAVVRLFLESQGVKPPERASSADIRAGDLTEAAREFTFQIACESAR